MLFGPAYKGIPLVAAIATILSEKHDLNVPFVFNRKEVKGHGEGGYLVGAQLSGRVVIVDDVITSGASVQHAVNIVKEAGAEPVALTIALDREEKTNGKSKSVVQTVSYELGLKVHAIARFSKLIEYLRDTPELVNEVRALEEYRNQYGSEE